MEGDIVLDNVMRELLKPKTHDEHYRGKRDTVANIIKLWPAGVVPYTIEDSIGKTTFCIKVQLICHKESIYYLTCNCQLNENERRKFVLLNLPS
jgi:hypothetical protein